MKKFIFTLALSTAVVFSGFAQQITSKREAKEEKKELKEAKQEQQNIIDIETPNFTFYPYTVQPEFGISHTLNIAAENLYLQVSKTNVSARLPFIGQFYLQPVEPFERPLNFYSNKFIYAVKTTDEINYEMSLVPSDLVSIMNEGLVITFNFNKNTNQGTVKITATNRSEISYTGYFQ